MEKTGIIFLPPHIGGKNLRAQPERRTYENSNQKKSRAEISIEENEIARCNKMLLNPNFVAKAPETKINAEKAKLADYQAQLDQYLVKKNSL